MIEVTRPLVMSRWYVGITLSFLWVSVLAQTPPFVPEPGSAKEFVTLASSPSTLIVQTDPADVSVDAIIAFNPDLKPNSVNVLDVTAGQASFLGLLAPAGISPGGQIFRAVVTLDAPVLGTMDFLATAAYNGDPRRARASMAIDVVPPPVVPTDPVIIIPGDGGVVPGQIIVDYFDGVSETVADQLRDSVSAVIGAPLTNVGSREPVTNSFVYQVNIDPTDSGADAVLQQAIEEFLANPGLVENAFQNRVIGGGE